MNPRPDRAATCGHDVTELVDFVEQPNGSVQITPLPFGPSRIEPRMVMWCECGEAVGGLIGVLRCGNCGRLWSVGRLEIGRVDVGGARP